MLKSGYLWYEWKIRGDISFSSFKVIGFIWLIWGASGSAAACFGYLSSSFRQPQSLWLGLCQWGIVFWGCFRGSWGEVSLECVSCGVSKGPWPVPEHWLFEGIWLIFFIKVIACWDGSVKRSGLIQRMVKYSLSLLQGVLSCMKIKGLDDPHPLGFPDISTLGSSLLPFYSCKPAHSWDSHARIWQRWPRQRCCEGSGSQHKVFGCLKQGMQHLLGAGNHSRVGCPHSLGHFLLYKINSSSWEDSGCRCKLGFSDHLKDS